jgi:periplasmic protein TonB
MGEAPLPRPRRPDKQDRVVVPIARAPVPDLVLTGEPSEVARRSIARRWLGLSVFGHLLILAALLYGLPAERLPPVHVMTITVIEPGPGGAGATGGGGGSGNPATAPQIVAMAAAQPRARPPTAVQPENQLPMPPAPPTPPVKSTTFPAPPIVKPTPPVRIALLPPPPPKPPVPEPRRTFHRTFSPSHFSPPVAAQRPAPPASLPNPSTAHSPVPTQSGTGTVSAQAPGAGHGPGGKTGQGAGAAGTGQGAIGDGVGPGDNYLERLYRHLLRYKSYPKEAVDRKQQGKVEIGFTIARDGSISDVHIERSSGYPDIDQATAAMVRRAAPMPPLPQSFKGNSARVKFPIDYRLGLFDQMF